MKVLLAGATGDAGGAVLTELLKRGHTVTALTRHSVPSKSNTAENLHWHSCDLLNDPQWHAGLDAPDVVISCLASRSGHPQDARAVEYEANTRLLNHALAHGAGQFILLSAICVQRPQLAFQFEKLRFEMALRDAPIAHTIIRPTAFFKSLSGQIARIRAGKAFLMFGDGRLTSCLPISFADLSRYIVDQIGRQEAQNSVLPIGGPGAALTPLDQAHALFEAFERPVKLRSVSPRFFDVLGAALWPAAQVLPWAANRAEFLRIGKYYATQSMLVWDRNTGGYSAKATPQTGQDTLQGYYQAIAKGTQNAPDLGSHKLF